MNKRTALTFLFVVATSFAGYCKKNENSVGKAVVQLGIAHVVNNTPLVLNDGRYVNAANDSFTVSMFKYYISNVKLTGENGKEYKESNSYHLINEVKPGSKEFSLNIPAGRYKQISFLVGVDSLHNVSGAQDGALDPLNAMFWDWNTGYIMLKMEGLLLQNNSELAFHLGGFKGKNKVLRRVNISFPEPLEVVNGRTPKIFLKADLAELFKTPNTISFSKTSAITIEGPEACMIADNFMDMFSLDHISQ